MTGPGGAEMMRRIQRDHQARGWRDVAYNIAVGEDGVYEGIGIGNRHLNSDAGESNTILLIGNYDTAGVPDAMVERTARLVAHGITAGWWVDVLTGGHRDIAATACPGKHAYAAIDQINTRARQLLEEDDMVHIIGKDRDGRYWSFKSTDHRGVEWSKETADWWWANGGIDMRNKFTGNVDLIELLKDSNDLAPLAGRPS